MHIYIRRERVRLRAKGAISVGVDGVLEMKGSLLYIVANDTTQIPFPGHRTGGGR